MVEGSDNGNMIALKYLSDSAKNWPEKTDRQIHQLTTYWTLALLPIHKAGGGTGSDEHTRLIPYGIN